MACTPIERGRTLSLDAQFKLTLGAMAFDVSLRAGKGVTALFGRSGAGKTTVLKAIAALLRPDTGHIRLGDRPLFDASAGIDEPPERRHIGFVFQDARLFPHLDVRANLSYGARRARRPTLAFDEVVTLLGLASLLDRRPVTLSGGERQRVAIGRALLAAPDLLAMDEPLSSIDRARRDEILPFLDRLRREARVPILMVTHEPEEILRLANDVVAIEAGRTVAAGPVADMFARPEMSAIFGRSERGSVVEGVVTTVGEDGLATVALDGASIEIASAGLAAGQRARLRIKAGDVALAIGAVSRTSVRNRVACVITDLRPEAGGPSVEVALASGNIALLSRVTKRSANELGLHPGLEVTALVKAVSVERAF